MEFSRKSIDKLGKRLAKEKTDEDLLLLQEYRKSFEKPLQEVFSIISQICKTKCIFAFRIKRLDSIIRKLQRFENNPANPGHKMVLSNMVDIAGCRCIIENNDENVQKRIAQKIRNKVKVVNEKNWLKGKDSGYKALHLYVDQSGKQIEVQVRTKSQHNWATLVEIIDLLFDKKIKEGEKAGNLNEFEKLFSKMGSLTDAEMLRLVDIEDQNMLFKKMCDVFASNYLKGRKQWVTGDNQWGNHYFVVSANKLGDDIVTDFEGYKDFEEAENRYFSKFKENPSANVVLIYTNIRDFEKISMAYSNYFLAMHGFFDSYKSLLESQISKMCKQKNLNAYNLVKIYENRVSLYSKLLMNEVKEIKSIWSDSSIPYREKNTWLNSVEKRSEELNRQTKGFLNNIENQMPKQSFWSKILSVFKN